MSTSTRTDVSFSSAGQRCDGWLYRPADPGPHPCVVMAHGFGGIRAARLDTFGERFSQAGIAALVFDYRHWGTSEGQPRGLIDLGRQRTDYRAAIAYARQLDGIDARKLAAWGCSFSSGHVITVAAKDSRLAAAVLTNPYIDGPSGIRKLWRVTSARVRMALVRAWLVDELRRVRRRSPRRVDIAGTPGSVALMTTPDAVAGYASILPSDRSGWEPAVPARVLRQIATDRPAGRACQITCPLLVSVCDHDQIAPIRPALHVAQAARRGELHRYPLHHFDVFTGTAFEQVVSDQTAFLQQTLLGQPS